MNAWSLRWSSIAAVHDVHRQAGLLAAAGCPPGAARAHTTVIGIGRVRARCSSSTRVHQRAAGGQHRVDHDHRPPGERLGQLVDVRLGLERLLVAADADEPDVGVGQQLLGGVHEPEPGAQDRHDDRLHGQPPRRRRGERRLDGVVDRRQRLAWPRRAAACRCARGSGGTARSASCASRMRASASATSGWSTTVTVTASRARRDRRHRGRLRRRTRLLGAQQRVARLDRGR